MGTTHTFWLGVSGETMQTAVGATLLHSESIVQRVRHACEAQT